MALVESINVPLGTKMPDFDLKDPFGKHFRGTSLRGDKGLLIVFTCNHCPYAKAVWPRVLRLAADAEKQGIKSVAINPNINPDYPDDSPEMMMEMIARLRMEFPYLVDETQDVAKKYKAQCTPDLYLLNKNFELVYHGRIDDNWQDESKVTSQELKAAIDNLAFGKAVDQNQKPSMGCSIKWVDS